MSIFSNHKKTNKIIILNKIKYLFFLILSILLLFFLIDLSDFDTKYINRAALNMDVKNLNSKYSKKFTNYLRFYYLKTYKFFNEESFKNRWGIENMEKRNLIPDELFIPKKKDNFAPSLYNLNEYETLNDWHRSHGNNFATRFSAHKLINSTNAYKMTLAWIYEPKKNKKYFENIQANPIYNEGIIYTPNSQNQIVAINAVDGNELWSFDIQEGIAAKRGLVLFDPKKNKHFSTKLKKKNLDARIFFTNNKNNVYALNAHSGKLINSFGNNGIVEVGLTPIPPIIYNNELIFIDTESRMIALDLISGKVKWKYDINKKKNSLLFANFFKGSPWGGFSLDHKRGLMFFTTGNPSDWHVGVDRPGNNLYGNSVVAFDLNKKEIKWYFQAVPHDLWNMDLAATPILTKIKKNQIETDVVVVISKLGNTFILDRETGESLYDLKKIKSPISNVPGEKTSAYQFNISLPEPVCRNKMTKSEINTLPYVDVKRLYKFFSVSEKGFPNPPKIGIKNIQVAGCVKWAGASVDTEKNILYVTTEQKPFFVSIIKNNDWIGKYTHLWEPFTDNKDYPAIKPPWGTIVALDINNGKILWKKTFGEYKELSKMNISKTGTSNRSGLTASKGNLIFASGTQDNLFSVINSISGEVIWTYEMTNPGSAPPLIYTYNKKQYIVVPAFEKSGKKIYAYSLN